MSAVAVSLHSPVVPNRNSDTLREYLDQAREILPAEYYALRRALMYLTSGVGKLDPESLYQVDCSWWVETGRKMCQWIQEAPGYEQKHRRLSGSSWWDPLDGRYQEISKSLDAGRCSYGDQLDLLIRYLNHINPDNDCTLPVLSADKRELIDFEIDGSRFRDERRLEGIVFPYKSLVAITAEIDLNTTTRYYLGGIAPVWVIPPDEERTFDGMHTGAIETAHHDLRHVQYDPTLHYALNRIPLFRRVHNRNQVELPWNHSDQQMEFQLSIATHMIKTWRALEHERAAVTARMQRLWDAATFHIVHEGIFDRVDTMSDTPIFSPAFGVEFLSSKQRRNEFVEAMWRYSFGKGWPKPIYEEHFGSERFGKREFERGCVEYLEALSSLHLR